MDTYEQKYKKAERANEYHFDGAKQCIIDTLEDIFPELKKSNDERIRKYLISLVKNWDKDGIFSKYTSNPNDIRQILVWLEKQGEQKSLTIDIKSMVDSYEQRLMKNGGVSNSPLVNMCVAAFKHGVENTLDKLHLKQILANSCETCKEEQNPFDYENANIQQKVFAPKVDMPRYSIGDVLCDKSCTTLNKESQSNFEITDIRNGMYICDKCSFPISQQDEYELVAKRIEQKPAWSEEDNKHYESCLTYFEEIKPDSVFYKDYLWFKSIKERINV